MKKVAVYAGSFDPITLGHIDIVKRARKVFDELHVVVADNPSKKYTFSKQERLKFAEESLGEIGGITVVAHEGLLIDYAKSVQAIALVRGLRALSDFDYEFHMATMNQDLCPTIETFFVTAASKYFYINSTTIKELAKNRADVSAYVPGYVAETMKEFYR